MKLLRTLAAAGVCWPLLAAAAPAAKELVLPDETVLWRASALPGYQKVMQQCMTCHSAHYAQYQPGSTPRGYWEAQVKRMKVVFNAPVPDADVELITDYLFKTYSKPGPAAAPIPAAGPGRK
jgi:hypothetical protein